MKILILSCNTGEGHNSTARAILKTAEADSAVCEIKNALSYFPSGTEKFICKGHVFLYKNAPELFGAGYRLFEHISRLSNEFKEKRERKGKEPINGNLSSISKQPFEKLYNDITDGAYDIVICVHVFASLMMTELKRNFGLDIPTYFVATDYTCSPGVNECELDGWFIPSERLIPEFAALGIPKSKLIPSGIPVREEFYTKMPPTEAKERLGLPKDKTVLLFMCGSMGVGPIKDTVEKLVSELDDGCAAAVICGRNEKLLSQLNYLKEQSPSFGERLFPVGYTAEVCAYMDAASLIITKAGGLSSTEAAVKRLPMVFIDAIPGLEVHNRSFFYKIGCAEFGETADETVSVALRLLGDKSALARMRENLSNNFGKRSAEEIYNHVKAQYRG